MTDPAAPLCYRCGRTGYVRWVDVHRFGDAGPRLLPAESYCLTEGCAEPNGSRRLDAPTPDEMRRWADALWLARHERLVTDRWADQ